MRDLVTREKELMRDDYQYWQEAGILAVLRPMPGSSMPSPPVITKREWPGSET